jgi:7-carboxy-7-deazaguanine synthase
MNEVFLLRSKQKDPTLWKLIIQLVSYLLVLSFLILVPRVGITTPGGKVVDEKFVAQHEKFRLHYENIQKMIEFHSDYHYKPVWDGTEANLQEIEDFRVKMNIPKDKTFVMPAGDTRETLIEMYPKVFEMVAERGYNMTGRDHIIAYDTERGV